MREEKIFNSLHISPDTMGSKNNMMNVLKAIITEPSVSNISIANELGLSCTGIGKIREKLETRGIIEGYDVKVNLESLGLTTFCLIHIKVTKEGWNYQGHLGVQDYITSNPNIVSVYRVPGRDITHILFCVFRNIKELDRFIHAIQAQLSDYVQLTDTYVFSHDSIVKDSRTDLLVKIIDEVEDRRMPEPVLFGKIMGDD